MTPDQEAIASIDVSLRRIATALEAKERREIKAIEERGKRIAEMLAINSTYGKLAAKPETEKEPVSVPYPDAYRDAMGKAYKPLDNPWGKLHPLDRPWWKFWP